MRNRRPLAASALAIALALMGAVIARADGASENQAFVEGKVSPAKLDKKKFKPVNFFVGVRTEANVTGMQQNPQSEYISFGKNAKFNLNKVPLCKTPIPNGATPQQARDMCPRKSYLGSGHGSVAFPGLNANDITVSVFSGPSKNQLQLQTYSPTLGTASPTVNAVIVRSNAGGAYGQALSVPHAPVTGSGIITEFNATIMKSTGVATARCKAKKFLFQRKVTYTDGSVDTANLTQRCKRKPRKHH